MESIKELKTTLSEVIDDFKSCIIHVNDLAIYSTVRNIKIFLFVFFLIFVILIFQSNSKAVFYLNFAKVLFISLVSYFIFCLSDYFWFLIKKGMVYKWNIKNKKHVKSLIERSKNNKNFEEVNFEEKIVYTAKYNSDGYKIHAKRYIAEISLLLLILLFIFPLFFLFNIALFCVMFVYVFLYETQPANQAFDDIGLLISCILRLHKENPVKCNAFITKNEKEEVKELSKLYDIVLNIT